MTKTTIKETTEKYDQNGKLIERVIREEISEDDTNYIPSITTNPYVTTISTPWCGNKSTTDMMEAKHDIC